MGEPQTTPDPVAERKQQNPAHTDLTKFYFVEHESFELLGGPWGGSDKYKDGVPLGPGSLDPDEFWPRVSEALRVACDKGTLADYVGKHKVTSRWVYAFSVEKGAPPQFCYELWLDSQGRVSYIERDDFLRIHDEPATDDEDDATYRERSEWKETKHAFLERKFPIGKAGSPIKWHFFGLRFRLTNRGVEEIEADASILQPDPGLDFFARAKDPMLDDEIEIWKEGCRVPVGDGFLVRVFDPMTVLDNLRKELHRHLDEFIRYSMPTNGDPDAQKRRWRQLVSAIANHADLVCKRSPKATIRHDDLKRFKDVWPELRTRCFTDAELRIIERDPLAQDSDAVLVFRRAQRRIREELLRRQVKAGTALMLWLSSKPWGLVERQCLLSDARIQAYAHEVLRVGAEALSRLGELDGGRHYLRLLIENHDGLYPEDVPNGSLIGQFVLRDTPAPAPESKSALDIAKVAFKAGKAPFNLWSKLVTLVTTMNKSYLDELVSKHAAALDSNVVKMFESLTEHKRVFSLSAVLMTRRLRNVYRCNLVQTDLKAFNLPNQQPGIIFYLPDGSSKGGTKPHIFELRRAENLKKEIGWLRDETGIKPGTGLTFEHVGKVTSVLSLFFSVRDLYLSGTDKSALDTTKSAFNVLKSVYALPWVQQKVSSKFTAASLRRLSEEVAGEGALEMAEVAAKRSLARIAFVVQIVTVAFAVQDVWSKASRSNSEAIVGSALSLSCEVMGLISITLVVYSGGTMTPLAAVFALAATATAVAQFVYELFRPDDHVYAVRHCLFGVGYKAELGSNDGRDWQACPGHDLRYFDPEFNGRGLQALRTQIAAFSNLMHGYAMRVAFSDDNNETGVWVEIFPGAVPRQAFFEIELNLVWWRNSARDESSPGRDDTWSADFRYKFYPFADNVPPRPISLAPRFYKTMRMNGVIDQDGGPFNVVVDKYPDRIKLYTYPKDGRQEWSGDLIGEVPVTIRKRLEPKYKMRSSVIDTGNGMPELEVEVVLSKKCTDLTLTGLKVVAKIEFNSGGSSTGTGWTEGQPPTPMGPEDELRVFPEDPAGRRKFRVRLGRKFWDGRSYRFVSFTYQLELQDKDKHTPRTLGLFSNPAEPGAEHTVSESVVSQPSDDKFHYSVRYDAKLGNYGPAATVDFTITGSSVWRSGDNPYEARQKNMRLEIDGVGMQYVRNEDDDERSAPIQAGTRDNPRWATFTRLPDRWGGDPSFSVILNRTTKLASPVFLFDILTFRFAVKMGTWILDKSEKWDARRVQWNYPRDDQPGPADSALIKSATCKMTLVLDGDPTTENFNPSKVSKSDRRAYVTATVTADSTMGVTEAIKLNPPSHRASGGPPESDVKKSIEACKV